MDRWVEITRDPVSVAVDRLPAPWSVGGATPPGMMAGRGTLSGATGAWVEFYGIVRDLEEATAADVASTGAAGSDTAATGSATRIRAIDYEAHEPMAQHQMHRIIDRLQAEHPLQAFLVIHRIGEVAAGEPSLVVRALSGHRNGALVAVAAFIHEMKQWVPIWKHPIPLEPNP